MTLCYWCSKVANLYVLLQRDRVYHCLCWTCFRRWKSFMELPVEIPSLELLL